MADGEEYSDDVEENVYKEGVREDLVDNDELTPEEEAFMKGYDDATDGDEVTLEEPEPEEEKE